MCICPFCQEAWTDFKWARYGCFGICGRFVHSDEDEQTIANQFSYVETFVDSWLFWRQCPQIGESARAACVDSREVVPQSQPPNLRQSAEGIGFDARYLVLHFRKNAHPCPFGVWSRKGFVLDRALETESPLGPEPEKLECFRKSLSQLVSRK